MENMITYLNYTQFRNSGLYKKANRAEITDYALMQSGICITKKHKNSFFDKNPEIIQYGEYALYHYGHYDEHNYHSYVRYNGHIDKDDFQHYGYPR